VFAIADGIRRSSTAPHIKISAANTVFVKRKVSRRH